MRVYRDRDLTWKGPDLYLGSKRVASVIPDPDWQNMYRVQMPGRDISDMVNLTRAKDAAKALALSFLNREERRAEASPMRPNEEAA